MSNEQGMGIESPDGIEPCCVPCSCSSCLPYDDGILILSQILSALAFLLSWFWPLTLVLSTAGIMLFLLPLCVRFKEHTVWVTALVVATFTSVTALVCGLYQLKTDCYYDLTHGRNVCYDLPAYGLFACAVFWAAAAIFMGIFLISGRHEKWEQHHRNKNGISDEDENNDRNDRVATRNTNRNTIRYPNRSTDRNPGRTRNRAPTLADLERAVDELERRTDCLSPEMMANGLLLLYNLKNDDDQQ